MNFEEHAAKSPVLARRHPGGARHVVHDGAAAAKAAAEIGPCVVKAQVPAGKRGEAGGIKLADYAGRSRKRGRGKSSACDRRLHGRAPAGRRAGRHSREFYAAVLHDVAARKPLILFSTEGGMDIEEIAAAKPDAIRRLLADIDGTPEAGRHRRHACRPQSRCAPSANRAIWPGSMPPIARMTQSSWR